MGDRTLFEGLSLALAPGDRVAVGGPSGSGKTALLRTLAWMDEPQGGQLRLDDRPPADWGATAWRAEVSWVAQRPPALGATPAEARALVEGFAAQRERDADDPVALAAEWGLEAGRWTQSWSTLSGGEQQRAWLALCLSRRPRVLLLDEPTSALDGAARDAVEASLRACTFLWVTHDDEQARRVADDVLELGR